MPYLIFTYRTQYLINRITAMVQVAKARNREYLFYSSIGVYCNLTVNYNIDGIFM